MHPAYDDATEEKTNLNFEDGGSFRQAMAQPKTFRTSKVDVIPLECVTGAVVPVLIQDVAGQGDFGCQPAEPLPEPLSVLPPPQNHILAATM